MSTTRRPRRRLGVEVQGVRPGAIPETLEPQLALLASAAPTGNQWLHEIKFDGYRMLCRIDVARIEFISRNQQSWTSRLQPLVEAMRKLKLDSALFDGEVVVLKPDGTTDFQALQNVFREGPLSALKYYIFDLLYLNGDDLTRCSLEDRKELLRQLLNSLTDAAGEENAVRYSEHFQGSGPEFVGEACRMHLEGIVCKRRDKPYRPGRSDEWLKVKCIQTEEFVIGGFTDPGGSRAGFGALLLGYHGPLGKLFYAGKVGTGFDQSTLQTLYEQLQARASKQSPFSQDQQHDIKIPRAHWVRPDLVAQIRYASRTRDGLVRHASFQGLREDKPAAEVVLDRPVDPQQIAEADQPAAEAPDSGPERPRAQRGVKMRSDSLASEHYDTQRQEFNGVRLTSPEKLLYPEAPLTKLDLAEYYLAVAEWILPHIQHRPLALVRCPEGETKECFYQKHPMPGTPAQLRQIPIEEKHKAAPYVLVDNVAGLTALAQIGTLEIHAWGAREDQLERPDRLIFDLDPDTAVPWKNVVAAAHHIRDLLQQGGLTSFVKTTGGKGLHIVVPIERRYDWEEAKTFCRLVASTIVTEAPDHFTATMSKAARPGKIFIDYFRNDRGATSVAPYSTRAHPHAPVSVPVSWTELTEDLKSDAFTVNNIRQRLETLPGDPWEGITAMHQRLTKARRFFSP